MQKHLFLEEKDEFDISVVDASAEIGNGHFYRCLNLAETFEKKHKNFFYIL